MRKRKLQRDTKSRPPIWGHSLFALFSAMSVQVITLDHSIRGGRRERKGWCRSQSNSSLWCCYDNVKKEIANKFNDITSF